MSRLSDLLRACEELAVKSLEPKVLKVPGLPADRMWMCFPGVDSVTEKLLPAPPLKAEAGSVDSLVQAVLNYTEDDEWEAAEIWYNDAQVVALPNRDGHEIVTLNLTKTKRWALLLALVGGGSYDQLQFVRLLRLQLGDALNGELLDRVRKLIFREQAKQEGLATHTKASIGKSLTMELDSEVAVPEEVSCSLHVFEQVPYEVTVQCAVEVDLPAKKFQLIPLPGQMEAGLEATMQWLHNTLSSLTGETDIAIYRGKCRLP